MRTSTLHKLTVAGSMIFLVLACNALLPATATPSPLAPTISIVATATMPPTSIPPTQALVLSSVAVSEDSQAPVYKIRASIPTLQGSADANVVNFNTALTNLVNSEIDAFKKSVAELPADTPFSGSSFDVTYALMLQRADFWGFQFDFSGYSAGAAHPYHYSRTVNYDLGLGRPLELSELFLPNSNYLTMIANYCSAELSQRDIAFEGFSDGAIPTPENYRNWSLTPDGLLITFDEYQVAPYAAAPQTVVVPYSELETIIDLQGPAGKIIQS